MARAPKPPKLDLKGVDLAALGPRSPENEQIFLGTLLLCEAGEQDAALAMVPTEDMSDPRTREVLAAMHALRAKEQPIDLPMMLAELRERGKLEDAGGISFLTGLEQQCLSIGSLVDQGVRIREDAQTRRALVAHYLCGIALNQNNREAYAYYRAELDAVEDAQSTASSGIGRVSARDLMAMSFPPIRWAVPGLIPEGLTMLAANPKIGKSWMMLQVADAVARGGFVLGRGDLRAERGAALYLALEDSLRRLRERMSVILEGADCPEGLDLVASNGGFPSLSCGGVKYISRWISEHADARLVVIDTLGRAAGRKGADSRDVYASDTQLLAPLQELAIERGIAIVVIHHLNKQQADDDTDPVSRINGSAGLAGVADGFIILTKEEQGGRRVGRLELRGRDVPEKTLMARQESTGLWVLEGDFQAILNTGQERAVLTQMELNREPMGPSEIAKALGSTRQNISRTLKRLEEKGQIVAVEKGRYAVKKDGEAHSPAASADGGANGATHARADAWEKRRRAWSGEKDDSEGVPT